MVISHCDYPVPKRLSGSANEIVSIFINPTPAQWDVALWASEFGGEKEFQAIRTRFHLGIGRDGIAVLSREVKDGGYEAVRELFMASQIWGFSGTSRAAYGPWRTRKALSLDTSVQLLKEAAIAVCKGELEEAFRTLKPLKWCQLPFRSKFLYFVGLGAGVKPLPLILDSRVGKSITLICSEEGWNPADFGVVLRYNKRKRRQVIGISHKWEGYRCYVDSVNKWGEALGCPRADHVESFLFREGKNSISKSQLGQNDESIRHRCQNGKQTARGGTPERQETMSRTREFAADYRDEYIEWARYYSRRNARCNLQAEADIIDEMMRPPAWDGIRWRRAVRGNFGLLWENRLVVLSPGFDDPRFRGSLDDYLKNTPEGKLWREKHKPDWLG